MENEDRRSSWQEVKRFEESGLVVRVNQLAGLRPRFSISIGSVRKDDPRLVSPYVPVRIEGQGAVSVRLAEPLAELLKRVEAWIQTTAQEHEDKYLDFRLAKEQRDAQRFQPKTRVTGKTAKKKERLRARGLS